MTKEEILALEPGTELDTLVEEKLFDHRCELRWCNWLPEGWFEAQSYGGGREVVTGGLLDENKLLPCYKEGEKWTVAPFYSTDISAAWPVLEKLTEEWTKRNKPVSIKVIYFCGAYETKIETWNENKHDWNKPIFSGSCEAAPEAICKAALLSKLEVKDD